jgi:hypothetical protein
MTFFPPLTKKETVRKSKRVMSRSETSENEQTYFRAAVPVSTRIFRKRNKRI